MLNRFFFHRHLDDDEEILLVLHKHWLMSIKALWFPTVVFVAVWSLLYFVRTKYAIYGVSIAALGIGILWIRNFLDYFLDVWVITDRGVIDLEWHGWFHRSSSRVLYSDVQGVSYEVQGIFATLLGYGVISLEKISTGDTISMSYVHRPRRIESLILGAMEAYLHTKNLKDAKTVQGILAEYVASSLQKQEVDEDERPKKMHRPPKK